MGCFQSGLIESGQVIGVVKDFNYKSLYDKVEPAVLQIFPDAAWKVAVKINTADAGNAIGKIKRYGTNLRPNIRWSINSG